MHDNSFMLTKYTEVSAFNATARDSGEKLANLSLDLASLYHH